MDNVLLAFLMSLFAGLSTGIGSGLALLTKRTNTRFMSFTLGFSAGVMMYVSMTEIMTKARVALTAPHGEKWGNILTVCAFFSGVMLIALISKFIPSFEGDRAQECIAKCQNGSHSSLMRMGVLSALAIAIHNFPEGMATFISALRDPGVAVPIVFAIAIHNIPEGIAVAAPVYRATGSRKKAFTVSFLSGVAEPVGALVGWLILIPFMSDTLFGTVFAAAAGIMVYICIDEIIPGAQADGEHALSVAGFVFGMALMALSLILFL